MKIAGYKIGLLTGLFVTAMAICGSGCASHRGGKRIAVEPGESVLTLDSARKAELDITFHVPESYFSKRSRLYLSPDLYSGDSLIKEYPQVVLDAPIFTKKSQRTAVLEKKIDSVAITSKEVDNRDAQSIPYRLTIEMPEGFDGGEVIAKVSTDGCGVCKGIDTLHLAGISNPVTLIDVKESFNLDWIEPDSRLNPRFVADKVLPGCSLSLTVTIYVPNSDVTKSNSILCWPNLGRYLPIRLRPSNV